MAIVEWMPALQCHPLAGLAIALVRLAWPWEEEPRDSEAIYVYTLACETISLNVSS